MGSSPATQKLPSLAALGHLEAACRLGSVTRAAKELGVSHAAISQSISGLELRFGPLLNQRGPNPRGQGELKPTAAATALISGYLRATGALARGVASAMSGEEEASFHIRVDRTFAEGWLSHHAASLVSEFPNAVVAAREGKGPQNVAISRADLKTDFPESTELFRDVLTPVCAPALMERFGFDQPSDLVRAPLICGDPTYWRNWLEAAGLDPNTPVRTIRMSEQSLRIRCAKDALGIALVNPMFVLPELESGELAIACNSVLARPHSYRAYWRGEDEKLPEVRRLIRWFYQATREKFTSLTASAACRPVLIGSAFGA